eukprot:TRINITY_DN4399_c0_g1_i1.p1 TRINITY_DN4399_c0_g1~~TRINITY_DN4399_c0_g1_i1.p1  ORF type:complete len:459 (-),score=54.98 TRINITY_DN4399_c0_g1_i1:573-1949(-)
MNGFNKRIERELSFGEYQKNHAVVQSDPGKILDLMDGLWFGFAPTDDHLKLACHRFQGLGDSLSYVATPCLSYKETSNRSPESDVDTKSSNVSPKHEYNNYNGPFGYRSISPQRHDPESTASSWKARQWLFPPHYNHQPKQDSLQQQQCNNQIVLCKSAPRPVPNCGHESTIEPELDENKIMEAAWKWRFRRKWGEEQRKMYGWVPDSAPSDEWQMALARIDDNHNLQFGMGMSGTVSARLTLESFGSELLGKASVTPSQGGNLKISPGEATHELKGIYSKAKTLAAERDRIEAEADLRWNQIQNQYQPWLGQRINMLQIEQDVDQRIILYEVIEQETQRSRLVIYGRANSSFEELDAEFRQKVRQLFGQGEDQTKQQQPVVEVLGYRELKWDVSRSQVSITTDEEFNKIFDVDQDETSQWVMQLLSQSLPSYTVVVQTVKQIKSQHGAQRVSSRIHF